MHTLTNARFQCTFLAEIKFVTIAIKNINLKSQLLMKTDFNCFEINKQKLKKLFMAM